MLKNVKILGVLSWKREAFEQKKVCGSEKVFWVGRPHRVTAFSPAYWVSHRVGNSLIRRGIQG